MVVTPWGRVDELRSRRLRPGPGTSREEVELNQRERLYGAMVAAVAENGYEKARVADLLEISGVSRNTFYKLFENKEGCFVATLDALLSGGAEQIFGAYLNSEGTWDERLAATLDALVQIIVENPDAARLYYVESYAAGPVAIERVERMSDQLELLARRALDQSPDHAGMPRNLIRAILRGLRRVIQTRLRTHREHELLTVGPELLEWALSYRTPPERLRRPRKVPRTFELPPDDPHDTRERILVAVIDLMSDKGYAALKITDIAKRAAISLTTFYALFEGKDEAVVAALRRSTNRVVNAVAPAYQAAPDWASAIGAALHTFFAVLAVEHPFARFGGVDVHSGSPLVVDVRAQLLTAGQAFLAEGHRQHPGASPIASEAIGASVDALLFDQVRRRGEDNLYEVAPTATLIALAPFVGTDKACAIANASR